MAAPAGDIDITVEEDSVGPAWELLALFCLLSAPCIVLFLAIRCAFVMTIV